VLLPRFELSPTDSIASFFFGLLILKIFYSVQEGFVLLCFVLFFSFFRWDIAV
jgi:hypothetical protein